MKHSTWELQSGFLYSAFPWQKATTLSACKHDPLSKVISGVSGQKSGTFGWLLFPKFSRRGMVKSIPSDDSALGSWGKHHIWPYSLCPTHAFLSSKTFHYQIRNTKTFKKGSRIEESFLGCKFLAVFFCSMSSLQTKDMKAIKSTHSLKHRKSNPHQGSSMEADLGTVKPFSRAIAGRAVCAVSDRGIAKPHSTSADRDIPLRETDSNSFHCRRETSQVSPVHTRCPCHQASSCSLLQHLTFSLASGDAEFPGH